MKLPAILATLTQEPLILTPATHASLIQIFRDHRSADRAEREGVDWCGNEVDLEQSEMVGGIMHIPINGPIGRGLGKFEKGAGAVDVGDISDEIDTAEADPNCKGIIFHIDCPGGMYNGTPELGERIMRCEKQTAAFIPGMACSGGYWIASSCDIVCATVSADIANVGVYCYLLDNSAIYEREGIKPDLITSGAYKGMGAPGISLSKEQRAHLQDRVNEMAETFYSHVEARRPDVQRVDMQGQCFKASSALDRGFIDQIVSGIDDVEELF